MRLIPIEMKIIFIKITRRVNCSDGLMHCDERDFHGEMMSMPLFWLALFIYIMIGGIAPSLLLNVVVFLLLKASNFFLVARNFLRLAMPPKNVGRSSRSFDGF